MLGVTSCVAIPSALFSMNAYDLHRYRRCCSFGIVMTILHMLLLICWISTFICFLPAFLVSLVRWVVSLVSCVWEWEYQISWAIIMAPVPWLFVNAITLVLSTLFFCIGSKPRQPTKPAKSPISAWIYVAPLVAGLRANKSSPLSGSMIHLLPDIARFIGGAGTSSGSNNSSPHRTTNDNANLTQVVELSSANEESKNDNNNNDNNDNNNNDENKTNLNIDDFTFMMHETLPSFLPNHQNYDEPTEVVIHDSSSLSSPTPLSPSLRLPPNPASASLSSIEVSMPMVIWHGGDGTRPHHRRTLTITSPYDIQLKQLLSSSLLTSLMTQVRKPRSCFSRWLHWMKVPLRISWIDWYYQKLIDIFGRYNGRSPQPSQPVQWNDEVFGCHGAAI
jgi:hypothetical protein